LKKINQFKILFISFVVFAVVISLFNINSVVRQMSDENLYDNIDGRVVFTQITPGGVSDYAGLRVGDIFLKINGESVRSSQHAQQYLDKAKPGESLIYSIERNGNTFDIKVDLAIGGMRIWHLGGIFAGILFLAFGLFLAISRPDIPHARLMALSAILFAIIMLNMEVSAQRAMNVWSYKIAAYIIAINMFFAIASMAHASLYFPERKYEKIKPFWMIYSHYISATVLTIFATSLIFTSRGFSPALITPALIYLGIIEIVFWRKRRKEYKARSRAFQIVVAILALTYALAMIISSQTAYAEYLAFSIILLPLAYFYTTVKYRVFDIQLRWRLSLVYNLLQILLILGFVLAIVFIVRILPMWNFNFPAIFLSGTSVDLYDIQSLPSDLQERVRIGYQILMGIILAFTAFVLKNKLKTLLDKLFFQQKYDYKIALKKFSKIISSAFTRYDISNQSLDQIYQIMKLKGTMIAFPENGYFQVSNSNGVLTDLKTRTFNLSEKLNHQLTNQINQIKPDDLKNVSSLREKSSEILCGVPIRSADKHLEAILFTGEKLSESPYNNEDIEILNFFAEHLGTALERARLYEDMADQERIKRELEIAREIQLNSLPKCEPDYSGLQICASLSAANEVGGDYYDYIEIDDDRLAILVGDVLGKGASAAFHMSRIQGFIQSLSIEMSDPADLLERLNSLIQKNFDPEFFFTALYGLFNTDKRQLNVYRLGHNGLFYYNYKQRKSSIIEPPGIGLGMTECEKFRAELKPEQIQYKQGDIFAFLTDGFLEAMNSDLTPFGEQNISKLIDKHHEKTASEIMDILTETIKKYSENKQVDDTTGIIVKIID